MLHFGYVPPIASTTRDIRVMSWYNIEFRKLIMYSMPKMIFKGWRLISHEYKELDHNMIASKQRHIELDHQFIT